MNFPTWPYVEGVSAWGEMSGKTERFCEMDCYMTSYIVEFINTTTNFLYIYLGVRGFLHTRKNSKDSLTLLNHGLLIIVGFGSTAYHMNIKYISQMADEISILYLINAILFTTLSITSQKSGYASTIAASLFALTTFVSTIHYNLALKEPYELVFITLLLTVLISSLRALFSNPSALALIPQARKELQSLLSWTTVLFITAIILQKADFAFCTHLTHARNRMGLPFGILTELHGWWHILTAIGVYDFITFVECLRINTVGGNKGRTTKELELVWKCVFDLPRVEVRGDIER